MKAPCIGAYYPWSNKGVVHLAISVRIEKAYINDLMLHSFPELMVQYLPEGISDHSYLVVTLSTEQIEGGRFFKFMNILNEDPNFHDIVVGASNSTNAHYKLKSIWLKL